MAGPLGRAAAWERVGHGGVEHRNGAEKHGLLVRGFAVLVALVDGDGGEDVDGLLALADAAVEREERFEAGDVGRSDSAGVAVDGDQQLVAEAVAGEAVAGADLDPAPPPIGGEQRAGGLLDALAVGLAARVALSLGEARSLGGAGHLRHPSGGWGPPGWRADPPPPAR